MGNFWTEESNYSPKILNWDVKIIQEIRRKDSDKMVQSFHEVVA
jgi:hypothetical protein